MCVCVCVCVFLPERKSSSLSWIMLLTTSTKWFHMYWLRSSLILYLFDLFVINCNGCKLLHSLWVINITGYFISCFLFCVTDLRPILRSTLRLSYFISWNCSANQTNSTGSACFIFTIFLFGVKNDFSNSSVLGFLHPMKLHVCIYIGDFILHNITRYRPLARRSAETASV